MAAGSATEYTSIQIYSARTNAYPFIGAISGAQQPEEQWSGKTPSQRLFTFN